MTILAMILGAALIGIILIDAFETIVLPRRVTRRVRFARVVVLSSWIAWSRAARLLSGEVDREGTGLRERFLSGFGPFALLLLLGSWASGLVIGFGLLIWGSGAPMAGSDSDPGLGTVLYLSGITFFTIGFGDVTPRETIGRLLAVAEGATGFSFLAVIIGYLPVIFSSYARRETNITLLDARAGSPPSASEFLRRLAALQDGHGFDPYLRDWEQWSAELLESSLSFPVLTYFRSQHDRQSWLSALTVILDTTALIVVGLDTASGPIPKAQARLTFAMARHAVGDLCQILNAPPRSPEQDRLPSADVERLREQLATAGLVLRPGPEADQQLTAMRTLYEPYVNALADRVLLVLPQLIREDTATDDWETTAWQWDPADIRIAMETQSTDGNSLTQ